MQWDATAGAGFTTPDAEPWLRLGDYPAVNVAAQRDDSASVLHFCRDLIALRRAHHDLAHGDLAALDCPPGVLAWHRGRRFVIALNLADSAATVDGVHGQIRLGTERVRDGRPTGATLSLLPWEGVLVETRS
jgi:alpha-glucosidase